MRHIPLLDLAAAHRALQPELEGAIRAVLEDGRFVGGPIVDAFEDAWAAYCGVEHAVGVANGTDALEIALAALGIGPGDEVIVPALTFAATAEAVVNAGARPVIVDISPATYLIDPAAVEAAVTARTAAVVVVHLYGQPADMDALRALTARHRLALIEDGAQAHGARWRGERVGSLADVGCFSFYPSKNLGAMGDAGAIVTRDPTVAARARAIGSHGQFERDVHALVGRSSRLDALQAAVLAVKLPQLDRWNGERNRLAALYDAGLGTLPGVTAPVVAGDATHVYHLYVVRVAAGGPAGGRDPLRASLAEQGIETRIHYPQPVDRQPAYADYGAPAGTPYARSAADEILSLPMFPQLGEDGVAYVIDAIARTVYARAAG